MLGTHTGATMSRPKIEDVVSHHTELRRSGRQLSGRCPLHAEKTPSFYVDPEKQVFYCHGCHAGGDVIAFVMALRGCEFGDAVRELGLDGADHAPPSDERTERIVEMLIEWRRGISPAISDRCRRLFHAEGVAREFAPALADELQREWEVLADFQESLWEPQGLLEMWAQREAVERIVL